MTEINLAILGLLAMPVLSSASINTPQDVEACQLLTRAEIQSALGQPVPEGLKDDGTTGEMKFSHCTYFKEKGSQLTTMLLTVWTYKSEDVVKQSFEASIKEAGDMEKVTGVGDGAFWWKDKTTFFVIKDNHMVSMFLGEDVASLEAAKKLAGIAVKRLQ
jgi:hypothetical protein